MKTDDAIRERLGRLPPKLEDLYLAIYEKFKNYPAEADRRISKNALALLLCAQRKLSSAEFLNALSMTPDGHVGIISKNQMLDTCCNLVVFDGTLDTFRFAHLSVREFLEKHPEYDVTCVNAIAAETCLQQLIAAEQYRVAKRITSEEPHHLMESPFVTNDSRSYPNLYWATHCQLAGVRRCNHPLGDLLRRFMFNESDPNSPFAIRIGALDQLSIEKSEPSEYLGYEGWGVDRKLIDTEAESARPLFIACVFNFYEVIRDQLTAQDFPNKLLNNRCQILLLLAVEHGSCEVISEFLNKDITQMTEEVAKAAAGNSWHSKEVMKLLFDQRGANVPITEEVAKAAAANAWHGKEVMALLFDRRGADVPITEEVAKAAAGNLRQSKEVMTLLFDQRGADVPITEAVAKAAAGNSRHGKEVMTLLFNQRGADVPITEAVAKAAAGNSRHGKEVMTLLFNQRGADVPITEEVVKAAAANSEHGRDLMTLLFDQRGADVPITEEVVKAAVRYLNRTKELTKLLFGRYWADFPTTEQRVAVIARSFDKEAMAMVLNSHGADVPITEEVAKAAAGNSRHGKEVMTLLFDRRGADVPITGEVIKAAIGNSKNANGIVWLLTQRCKDPSLSGDIVYIILTDFYWIVADILSNLSPELESILATCPGFEKLTPTLVRVKPDGWVYIHLRRSLARG
jgi:hypothetical protein